MKISGFHIKNYRSIVDSGKCSLSPDHITALIGQNESGKTSVLEALRSFYEGNITDDVLRSDLTFPEITCTFILDDGKTLGDYIEMSSLPLELRQSIEAKKEVSVTRRWLNTRHNSFSIAEPEIISFFNELKSTELASADKIISSIPYLLSQVQSANHESESVTKIVNEVRNKRHHLQSKADEIKRNLSKSKNTESKASAKIELSAIEEQAMQLERELTELADQQSDKFKILEGLTASLKLCRLYSEQSARALELNRELRSLADQIREMEFRAKVCRTEREARNLRKLIEQLKESQQRQSNELNQLKNESSVNRRTADKLLSGIEYSVAEREAMTEFRMEAAYTTPESMGASIWKYIPAFEFFEDFSSLLPNKIDLEDLLNESTHVEGYKAARNFLFVAGLNADFFREENHRILKQKIENLNTEITVDFQDYWRQSVGKNDKIRINFELEHYDNTQPEKSGKPYLEFWIKDKQERLYPKQRSRGVRWFLSFYLELKATAISNKSDRVILIDEPGISLHARAQEDVLKVFEDLRQNLQIIYSTHSPNLLDLKKLYRIIAVQRFNENDETSETLVLDSHKLNEASSDTLSPIYALMGNRLNERQFVFPKNNFIVEDTVTFHYLEAMLNLRGSEIPVHFIPSSGAELVPSLTNMLFGWKISFGLIMMDNRVTENISGFLKETTFFSNGWSKRLIFLKGVSAIEDLFSTIDFKRFVLKQRIGIPIKNSEFIEANKLSRIVMVSDFHTRIKEENLHYSDFDDETRQNFDNLFSQMKNSLDTE